ncbi:hypothetical protein M1590_00300 [Candidatus Marsarchaeota archaeon]|nr:hypothetical protein [Candidatus Marsarchaeota archaeon]
MNYFESANKLRSAVPRIKEYAFICLIYLAIAILLFLPEIGNVFTTVPGNNADVYQNMWNLWWAKYALLNAHTNIYSNTTILFYPLGFNLVFQTLSPISGWISIPFQFISLEFAYNVLFFLGFVVGGFGAFLLIEYILKNRIAAFLGGVFFSFSSFHIAYSINHLS